MKGPPQELVDALLRGEDLRCATDHPWTQKQPNHVAHFYCAQCRAPRCGLCVFNGACVVCRALVRSTQNILFAHRENLA